MRTKLKNNVYAVDNVITEMTGNKLHSIGRSSRLFHYNLND